ncbi:uncharacterized protein LOC101241511 isoform X1 [Hydra vulgaris]|uniref:Uncharacterized protein LOC101241511 isoform X1 n=1 Tax=Hydra vulgaris TaxID=6087 RepID=A0ABM4D2Z6_HYDVU
MALVFMIVLLSFLCGFSVILNVTVVLTILAKGNSKNIRDVILMSLAICDGVQCTLGYPAELFGYANYKNPSLTEKFCKPSGFIVMYLALTAIAHLVCLCIYRYLTIVHPLKLQAFLTKSNWSAYCCITFCWIYGLFWSLSPLLGWNEIVREKQDTYRCSINLYPDNETKSSYLYALAIFCYLIPLIIIIYCSLKVHLELRNMLKMCKQISGVEANITKVTYRIEKQDFISVSFIIASFFAVWTPYAVCVFYLTIGKNLPPSFLTYCALFAKSSTILNPIIYCLMYKKFRQTIQSKFWKFFNNPTVAPIA